MEKNNTIEVLKEELELNSYGGRKDLDLALKEALLALEQKEKIKDIRDWLDFIIFNIEDLNYDSEEEYIKDLKIVNRKLKRLVEGVEK